jgi:hypothetical protein
MALECGFMERMTESNPHDQLGSPVARPDAGPALTQVLVIGVDLSVSDRGGPPSTLACGMYVARAQGARRGSRCLIWSLLPLCWLGPGWSGPAARLVCLACPVPAASVLELGKYL